MREPTVFDNYEGRNAYLYVIKSDKLSVGLIDHGARIAFIEFMGVHVALGFKNISEYMKGGCMGATIGRVANRIAGAKFKLDGKTYNLSNNKAPNHHHGGFLGFDKHFFDTVSYDEKSVTFRYVSADGEEGYPGKLTLDVTYTVDGGSLNILFDAVSDKDTLWGPTNHAYFNLDGEDASDCLGALLQINADVYTLTDAVLVPDGRLKNVAGTPFDFTELKRIGEHIADEELEATSGYDHNFVLKGEHAVHAESIKTGITLDEYTDLPCVQLYTSGGLGIREGLSHTYGKWSGFCVEPQFSPNAINIDSFKKPILKKGENKTHYIRYEFGKI